MNSVATKILYLFIPIFAVYCGASEPVKLPKSFSTGDITYQEDAEVTDAQADILSQVCVPNCAGKKCGSDGCGGLCGKCPEGSSCDNGECICTPQCEEKECGDDGCGGNCGVCPNQCTGKKNDPSLCVDGTCLQPCCPDCNGKQCGDDGCGGVCGTCPNPCSGEENDPELCIEYVCVKPCCPDCADKECGDDGCGGSCGNCEEGFQCLQGQCKCKPDCAGKNCGDDGCGGSCGNCFFPNEICSNQGKCTCLPDCEDKQCGGDGCGGSCGSCPSGQLCDLTSGTCKSGDCLIPPDNAFQLSSRAKSLQIGKDGHPGNGLDVDENPESCAPTNQCSNGIDNQLSSLLELAAGFFDVNQNLQQAVETGQLNLIFDNIDYKGEGIMFKIALYYASPVKTVTECNFQVENCPFEVSTASFDQQTCLPIILFDNATVINGLLKAGGPGYTFKFPLFFSYGDDAVQTLVPAEMTKLEAKLEEDNNLQKLTGVLAGAVSWSSIQDAIMQLPNDLLPVDKQTLIGLLSMFLNPDIDADGDGNPESISFGLKFQSSPVTIQ